MGTPFFYADALCREIEHVPIRQTLSKEVQQAVDHLRAERIEPELIVATTNQRCSATIHNTRASPEEKLLIGLIRSKIRFLLTVEPVKARIDEEKVKKEMEQLEKIAVIAYFVGRQLTSKTLVDWFDALGKEVQEDLKFGQDLGQGFFQIMYKGEVAAQKVLMRTPHHSRWGTSIMQPWCMGFNPKKPEKMKMPVWVT